MGFGVAEGGAVKSTPEYELPPGKRIPPCVAAAFSLRPRPAQSSILRGTGDPLMLGLTS